MHCALKLRFDGTNSNRYADVSPDRTGARPPAQRARRLQRDSISCALRETRTRAARARETRDHGQAQPGRIHAGSPGNEGAKVSWPSRKVVRRGSPPAMVFVMVVLASIFFRAGGTMVHAAGAVAPVALGSRTMRRAPGTIMAAAAERQRAPEALVHRPRLFRISSARSPIDIKDQGAAQRGLDGALRGGLVPDREGHGGAARPHASRPSGSLSRLCAR